MGRRAVSPPIEPMLARRADSVPVGEGLVYEPKWDGFRMIAFRTARGVLQQSRDLKDIGRYFPELEGPLLAALAPGTVVDGEIVVADPGRGGALDFDALLQRIHPAASRVERLARETPASYVVFDLIAQGGVDLRERPFEERRARLEEHAAALVPPLHLTPATDAPEVARAWFESLEGAGLDGIVAKRKDLPYQPGKRAMIKVKHDRTADCVVGGFRWHEGAEGERVGSLLLGLYDDGRLEHVGVAASFDAATRARLAVELAPVRIAPGEAHPWAAPAPGAPRSMRVPGGASRWSRGKDASFVPLRPERVVEVAYDHLQSGRFRHTARFVRWRPDKPAAECTYAQLDAAPPAELTALFTGAAGHPRAARAAPSQEARAAARPRASRGAAATARPSRRGPPPRPRA